VIALLALFPGGLIIVPAFVTIYRTGNRLRSMQRAAGMTPNVIPIVGLVLAFVFSLYALYYQVSLNGIWSNYGNQPENTPVAIQS
jgi:ABC-type spermidine/putrescine transport system permease subunit II